MYYKICEDCGAYLDPGETCDCKEERRKALEEAEQLRMEYLVIEGNGQLRMALKEIVA